MNAVEPTRAMLKGAIVLTLATVSHSAAAEVAWSVDANVSHTDNATLAETATVSDTIASLGGSLAIEHKGSRLETSLDARGDYLHYVDDVYDDDFQGHARGSLLFGIIPGSLYWAIEDTYGQIAVNQFEPVTPDNRQDVNVLSTGPDFLMRIGRQSALELSARYEDVSYEQSDQVDSENLYGSISFTRNISRNSFWGIVASNVRVEYDAPGIEPYDRPALYGTLHSETGRQTLSIDVGANRVERHGESFTKPLVRIDWQRRVAPSWTLNVNAGSEYQNTAGQFVNQNGRANEDPMDQEFGITDAPAAAYYGGTSIHFERPRTRLRIAGGYEKLDYVAFEDLNSKAWRWSADVSRQLTPQLAGFVSYAAEKREYEANTGNDLRQSAEFRFEYRAGRSTFVTLGYRYTDSDGEVGLRSYDANLFYLGLSRRRGSVGGSTPY